jgi:tRNA (cmo5U34)-methyltransferase
VTEDASSLGHEPGEKWKFDAGVAEVFADMLARSIPQYPLMRRLVSDLAARRVRGIVERGGGFSANVLDLGCSRGDALLAVRDAVRIHRGDAEIVGQRFRGIEISEPMLAAARERAAAFPDVEIERGDLRDGIDVVSGTCAVVLAILTLQFVPIEHRLALVADAHRVLTPGGATIVVEKVLGATAAIDREFVEVHHDMKRRNGYSQEEIDRKRLSLEGVLVPVTAKWNEDLLRAAGFVEVDCFWRFANFAGWIAVKGAR